MTVSAEIRIYFLLLPSFVYLLVNHRDGTVVSISICKGPIALICYTICFDK